MKNYLKDLVSVIIPTYNCGHTLKRALDSVYAQNYPLFEIIVIDDGSTDNTQTLINNYKDLKLIISYERRGASTARNKGIKHATGEYIAFLDADDEWLPQKISKQIDLIKRSPLKPGLVTCNSLVAGVNFKYSTCNNFHKVVKPHRGARVTVEILKINFIPTSTVMVKSDVFLKVNGFDENLLLSEDLDLWARISLHFSVDYLDEVLVKIYDRPGSLMDEKGNLGCETSLNVIRNICSQNKTIISNEDQRIIFGTRYLTIARLAYPKKNYYTAIEYCLKAIKKRINVFRAIFIILKCILLLVRKTIG